MRKLLGREERLPDSMSVADGEKFLEGKIFQTTRRFVGAYTDRSGKVTTFRTDKNEVVMSFEHVAGSLTPVSRLEAESAAQKFIEEYRTTQPRLDKKVVQTAAFELSRAVAV